MRPWFWEEFKKTFAHYGIVDEKFVASLFDPLASAYAEGWRRYHGIPHIVENDSLIMRFAAEAQDFRKVKIANFYHDAVYVVGAEDNERKSAEWAVKDLTACGAFSPQFIDGIYARIVATRHAGNLVVHDEQLIADVYLAGLGQPWETYLHNGRLVRQEYSAFSDEERKRGRAAWLKSMLERKYIYYLRPFRECFEKQAQANLSRDLQELEKVS